MTTYHATTILAVRKGGKVAMGGDGQVSIGETIVKAQANKIRALGAFWPGLLIRSRAITLYEKFEEKLTGTRKPAASFVESKDWRVTGSPPVGGLLIVSDVEHTFLLVAPGVDRAR
jgi:ATP-dependent HslUV protease subunit HslV